MSLQFETPESGEEMILKVLDCHKFGDFAISEGETFPSFDDGPEALNIFAFKHGIDSKLLYHHEHMTRNMTYVEAHARASFFFGVGEPPVINTIPRAPRQTEAHGEHYEDR